MKYEDALKAWVVNKYGYDINHIVSVDVYLSTEYGGYCETCDYSEAVVRVRVRFNDNNVREFSYYDSNFSTLLEEILEAANGDNN